MNKLTYVTTFAPFTTNDAVKVQTGYGDRHAFTIP
jgi:hypothetical protein